jgi:putative transcriptional regulator
VKNTLVLALLVLGAFTARAEDLPKPMLLVAAPELQGLYSRTAVLVVPMHGRHAGFILNRATELKLGALFPEHEPSAKVVDPVYFGGPAMVEALFAVVRRNPGMPAIRLFGEVFVTADAEAVDHIIEHTPNEARYFIGFVGWEPGELESEIDAGYWYVADPDEALLFHKDPETMWEDLVQRHGRLRPGMQQTRVRRDPQV